MAVGDLVVYPAHGVGRVVAREERLVQSAIREVVVLDLADGLSVTLPVELARMQLRPLLSQTDLERVRATLREAPTPADAVWLKRRKETQVKIAGGDPLELAEVVRDGAFRERRRIANGKSQLSPAEKDLYKRARRLLSTEICHANGLEPIAADAWIDRQLGATS
jgi:CarD family transcriptional regulator